MGIDDTDSTVFIGPFSENRTAFWVFDPIVCRYFYIQLDTKSMKFGEHGILYMYLRSGIRQQVINSLSRYDARMAGSN